MAVCRLMFRRLYVGAKAIDFTRPCNVIAYCHFSTMSKGIKQVPRKWPIPGIKHTVLLASGKGGVGKSTTAVNVAVALSRLAEKPVVGLLDADIYGPSIPKMMNLSGQPQLSKQDKMIPLMNYGIKCMSMGFLVEERSAIVWRGLMVMSAVQKLLRGVDWGELDVLVIDMPPGTGDAQLTISEQIPVSGVVLVTTPQDIALLDVRRGAEMFRQVNTPVIGVVQNMSAFVCPKCGHSSHIFGQDGGHKVAREIGAPILGDVPLDMVVREGSDSGQPVTIAQPDGDVSQSYGSIASQIWNKLLIDSTSRD
nr:ATP-binding protein involved in chromosome partitioning NUBPL/IND1 [Halisarca dujardinii]